MFDTLVARLISSYPATIYPNPSSWIAFSTDFSQINSNYSRICHAEMRTHPDGKYDELLTAVPYSDELYLDYIKGLIDGPFRQWKDLINLKQRDKHYYLHVTGLDTFPAKALYNFCIATRAPIEFPDNVKRWKQLVDLGMDPGLAFLVSARNLTSNTPMWTSKMTSLTVPSAGHWWFNSNSDWSPLINGKPEIDQKISYKIGPSYCTPTNVIWGNVGREFGLTLCKISLQEIQEHFKQ